MTDRAFEYITSVDKYARLTFRKDQMTLHIIPVVEQGKFPVNHTEAKKMFTKSLFTIRLWYDVPTNSLQYCFAANPFFKDVILAETVDKDMLRFLASCKDRDDLDEDEIPDTEDTKYFDLIIVENGKGFEEVF